MMTRQKFYTEIGVQRSHVLVTSDFFFLLFLRIKLFQIRTILLMILFVLNYYRFYL
ncbi:hypothetical protein O3M35_010748 [Rhynocoris fuscipes]|uniref:Uncharacterized protein n=1 Tax=Rhynocoris fuscipes TaxID=488301 RepID=A0AAW1D2W3_9HEMI